MSDVQESDVMRFPDPGKVVVHNEVQFTEQLHHLAAALAKAQGEIQGAEKGNINPHFKSRYADLASIWEACRAPLTKHGLAVIQMPSLCDGEVRMTTMLAHSSGQWIISLLSAVPMKLDPQAVGSVVTYLRRYSLAAMVGVAPEDDDAEQAMQRPNPSQALPPPSQAPANEETVAKWGAKFEKAKTTQEVAKLKSDAKVSIKEHATLLALAPVVEAASKRVEATKENGRND